MFAIANIFSCLFFSFKILICIIKIYFLFRGCKCKILSERKFSDNNKTFSKLMCGIRQERFFIF